MNIRKICIIGMLMICVFMNNIYAFQKIKKADDNIQVIFNDDGQPQEETPNEELKLYSESAIVMEQKTGKILYEKDCHARKYPASTTKILTAILALENCELTDTAVASQYACKLPSGYTKADIQPGETFTIEQLINVLMLQSANDAATVLAEHIGGSEAGFAEMMNNKATEIGCLDTHFVNANGIHNENHYTTAYDLAMIARYCMQNSKFREIAVLKEASLPWTEFWGQEQVDEHGERNFKATNKLMQPDSQFYYPYCNGIKAGFTTPAKNCLVSSSSKDGFELITVILHAELTEEGVSARYVDTINLFEYGYNHYNLDDILEEYDMLEYQVQPKVEKSNSVINVFKNYSEEVIKDDKLLSNIIKMLVGIGMIFVIIITYLIRKFIFGKKKLYDLKLN